MGYDQRKHEFSTKTFLRDLRPSYVRFGDWLKHKNVNLMFFIGGIALIGFSRPVTAYIDLIFLIYCLTYWWLISRDRKLPAKLPILANYKDKNNMGPGRSGKPEGILFVGNERKTTEEVWISGSDAKTHILYLGTTGSGKTEGLKSFATNALAWGSGFVYIDGKADTDLWSSLSSLCRRFGRDDDLLVLNYMTGNSDARAPSNTMNPFSHGSAAYLSAMLETLMPEAEGDNAMWKERAVALIKSLMPVLTWKRDNQDIPLSIGTIRQYLNLDKIIALSKDEVIPDKLRESLVGYLETLPGYNPDAFDENGKEKPLGPNQPMMDTTTVHQQHGYLTMQFTRALQSLGDDYGYIFDAQDADVDMVDIVLNRRILITLIPALEKSPDETANLGKILSATLKGMMGSTLGANLEGESAKVIENKPSHSATPFMTIFDEVGYYTAAGMAVMAAQARSLGFCLIFAAQDLQAMEKRVKEEARSITANCNLKIFGKLEDPTQTREFFENQIGKGNVLMAKGFKLSGGQSAGSYYDTQDASVETKNRADYDDLKEQKEGEAIISFGMDVIRANIFYSNPGHASAMRVTRYVALPPPDEVFIKHADQITKLRDRLCHKTWTAMKADVAVETPDILKKIKEGMALAVDKMDSPSEYGIAALGATHNVLFPEEAEAAKEAAKAGPVPSVPVSPAPQDIQKPEPQQTAPIPTPDAQPQPTVQTTPPASPQSTPAKEPISWDSLVVEAAPQAQVSPEPATPPTQAAQKPATNPEAEKIIKEAGEDMKSKLFTSDDE